MFRVELSPIALCCGLFHCCRSTHVLWRRLRAPPTRHTRAHPSDTTAVGSTRCDALGARQRCRRTGGMAFPWRPRRGPRCDFCDRRVISVGHARVSRPPHRGRGWIALSFSSAIVWLRCVRMLRDPATAVARSPPAHRFAAALWSLLRRAMRASSPRRRDGSSPCPLVLAFRLVTLVVVLSLPCLILGYTTLAGVPCSTGQYDGAFQCPTYGSPNTFAASAGNVIVTPGSGQLAMCMSYWSTKHTNHSTHTRRACSEQR